MTNQELAAIEEILSAASWETRSFAMAGALSAARRLLDEVRRLKGYEEILLKMMHERQRAMLEAMGEDA